MKNKTRVRDSDALAEKPPAFKEESAFLEITSEGKVTVCDIGRKESRFIFGGVVFLQSSGGRQLRAAARDLSLHGVGIRIHKRLKNYGIGSRMELEFAYPHALSGLLIEVELKRVREVENGYSDCGFEIVSQNKLLIMRLTALIASYERADIWKSGV